MGDTPGSCGNGAGVIDSCWIADHDRPVQPWYELRLLFKPDAALASPVDLLQLADALAPVLGAGMLDAVTMAQVMPRRL